MGRKGGANSGSWSRRWAGIALAIVSAAWLGSACSSTKADASSPKIDGGPVNVDAVVVEVSTGTGDATTAVFDARDATDRAGDVSDATDGHAPADCPGPSDPLWPPPTVHIGSGFPVGATPRGSNSLLVPDATVLWTATDGPGQTGAGTFTDSAAFFTSFSCTQIGDLQIAVHVFLPGTSCDTSLSWMVQCQP